MPIHHRYMWKKRNRKRFLKGEVFIRDTRYYQYGLAPLAPLSLNEAEFSLESRRDSGLHSFTSSRHLDLSFQLQHRSNTTKQTIGQPQEPTPHPAKPHLSDPPVIVPTLATMSDFNYGGTEEESAEIKKLDAEVVSYSEDICATLQLLTYHHSLRILITSSTGRNWYAPQSLLKAV